MVSTHVCKASTLVIASLRWSLHSHLPPARIPPSPRFGAILHSKFCSSQKIKAHHYFNMAIVDSNPEVLLRKRKNSDRKRIQKQQEAKEKLAKAEKLKKSAQRTKFYRAEVLVRNHRANELERKRINNVITQQESGISQGKEIEPKLIFVIRIPNYKKGLQIPQQAQQILTVLKLVEVNTGVFVKLTSKTLNLLNIIAPYILIGKPSLVSIRKLFQKRANIIGEAEENTEELVDFKQNVIKLDTNQLVEDKFEDLGLVCIEDLIHELVSLSENFVSITSWLLPFQLNAPVGGWGPEAKLAKLVHETENHKSISLSRDFKITEVADIDAILDQQN